MAGTSTIEWTEATWNPTTGCDRVSAGCDNCYALTLAKRLKAMNQPRYQVDGDPRTSGPGFGVTLHPDSIETPLSWRKPRMIFVNSMSDLFHAKIPVSYLQDVFDTISRAPQHTFQVLTKRSLRLARVADKLQWPTNLWMGVTVESQDYVERISHLRSVPAEVKFVSAEPLLGHLGAVDLSEIDWLIAGGESGRNARPVEEDWILNLRDQALLTGTSFFFKQWGGRTPKAGGRMLQGRTWDEFPTGK